ncbi:hypothetical protein H0H92_005591 [Tricholoma furcatifolium]|nr:hypothetical protein H0H92_005591 [Tricholoma furcatifolium]
MFQQLLDVMVNDWSTSIHRNVIAAAQRLAGASGLYPTCYDLDGVTDTGIYECSGGFADVFKADFRGQAVCLKTIRLNSRTDSEHFLKGNILVNESGRACVADFGLSSVSNKEILAWTSHSPVASKGGTVRWQAPELFDPEGEEDVHNTKASDIYAWAFVAYEIFTGEAPLAHISRDTTIVHKVLGGERPRRPPNSSPSWSAWGLTEDIWELMETCWNPDPAQRPNVSVVVERLQWALPRNIQKDAEAETNGDSLSPGQFRKMARGEVDQNELFVETLESFSNCRAYVVVMGRAKQTDRKLSQAISSIKEKGFRSPNDFIESFYNSPDHMAQSLRYQENKSYSPARILDLWTTHVPPGSESERQLHLTITRKAAEIMVTGRFE